MASCLGQGRPEMYGLGIRLGLYLQWLGEIIIEYVEDADVGDIRMLGLVFSGAVILALIVNIIQDTIQPADVYIVLQLASGIYVHLIPIHLWRGLTCCSPTWDPLKWTREVTMPIFDISMTGLLIVISALGMWFFTTYLQNEVKNCPQYGFFFAKIRLDNAAYLVVNVIVYVCILLVCTGSILIWCDFWDGQVEPKKPRRKKRRRRHTQFMGGAIETIDDLDARDQARRERAERAERRRWRKEQEQKDLIRTMRGISNLTVYGLHIAAIELTIQWNQFDNVNAVNSSGQTIPLLVSFAILFRAITSHLYAKKNGNNPEPTVTTPELDPTPPSAPDATDTPPEQLHQPYGPFSYGTYSGHPQVPPFPDAPDHLEHMDMEDVSANFEPQSDEYWLARAWIANRDAAAEAEAAQERERRERAFRRPSSAHLRGVTVL